MTTHHVPPAGPGNSDFRGLGNGTETELWDCSALDKHSYEELLELEARGAKPSLYSCGNHFLNVPDYVPE